MIYKNINIKISVTMMHTVFVGSTQGSTQVLPAAHTMDTRDLNQSNSG